MELIGLNPTFFAYFGAAALVAALAFLWGGQSKITGAALLAFGVVYSNIVYAFYTQRMFGTAGMAIAFGALDAAYFAAFGAISRRGTRLDRTRWAGLLVLVQAAMFGVDLAAGVSDALVRSLVWNYLVNGLTVMALVICAVAFTPKSGREAREILRLKLLYLRADLFRARAAVGLPMNGKNEALTFVDARIGDRIRSARELRRWSQEELSRQTGASVAQIDRFETGAERVSAAALFELARLLSVEIGYFYEGLESGAAARPRPAEET